MDERVLALCELSNDMLFHKIPQEQLPLYVDGSIGAGRETARALEGRDIFDLYRESGVAIRESGSGKRGYGLILRGQATMGKEGCSVEVFRDSIQALSQHSGGPGEPCLTYDEALRIHLAHEYFHFWEYQSGSSIVERLPSVTTLTVLKLQRKAKINRCAEAAAHAFAKELLGLPDLPNLYDYRYLIDTGAMEQAAFDKLYGDMAAMLSRNER